MSAETPNAVVAEMCRRYSGAVNAGDADAYSQLFADDAIWMPPGALSRQGPAEIKAAEGADYEIEQLAVAFTLGNALLIANDWIYGIAHVDGTATKIGDASNRSFRLTVTWLLNRQSDGSWKIKRQMWNHKPSEDH